MTPSSEFNSTDWGNLTPGYTPVAPGALLGSDIVYMAYRIAGILAEPGRGYSVSEGIDGLRVMNSLINGWLAERLMVWAYLRTTWVINAGQKSYRIGNVGVQLAPFAPASQVGFDWGPIPRPEEIKLAGFIFTNTQPNVETPMRILSYQQWAGLSPKDLQSTIEYICYYQPDVPNGTLFLWPVPTDPSVTVAIYTWQNLQQIPQLSTALVLPPAYQALLEYGLAIRLAGMFPRRSKLDPNAAQQFYNAKLQCTAPNAPELLSRCEWSAGGYKESRGRFMIESGTYAGGLGSV